MVHKVLLTTLALIFINFSNVRTLNLSEKKIKHAIGSSLFSLLNRTCPTDISSTYNNRSMTPFTEIRLGCLPNKTENSQINISFCNKGPCVDPSSGKKINNTYIDPIKRRIRINEDEIRLPVGCECKVRKQRIFKCFN